MNAESGTGSEDEKHRSLKFLIITSDKYPPMRVDVSILFGQEMVRLGHQIDWILQSEAACEKPYFTEWKNCRVWVGPADLGETRFHRIRKHLLGIVNDFKSFRLIRENGYDFVQVKDKFLIAPIAALFAKYHGSKFTYWLSYPFPEESIYRARDGSARYPLLYLIRGWFQKFLLYRVIVPLSEHIFVQSEQMKQDFIAEGVPSVKLTPVPMGIALDTLPELIDPFEGQEQDRRLRVVYLGTLAKIRKMDFLVRVFSLVAERIKNAHLYLVGAGDDPSDEKILWDEAERLGIKDKMTITGFLPQPEAWGYVANADVCVSPFYPTPILNSTSPTKLIEYMALGKPVVANDHPEQKLVISESGSGLCVPYEEGAFSAAIEMILLNPDLAMRMGEKGSIYVTRKRTYDNIVQLVNHTYYGLGLNKKSKSCK